MRRIQKIWLSGGVLILAAAAIPTVARGFFPLPQAASSEPVTTVNSASGPCTADFVVTDAGGKGIYNAKIEIQIRYGFSGGFHRIDATVGTNSDGKARMEGLPGQIKRTAEFEISYNGQSKSIPYDPLANCHPQEKVVLGTK